MTGLQSSQEFIRALKSTTDPPSADGPSKVEIARRVWDDASFYVPNKAEVIADWILTKLLKERVNEREQNSILDFQYWRLLRDVIHSNEHVARPLKTWLSAILVRVPIAPIVSSYMELYALYEPQQSKMPEVSGACLVLLWPLGVQKVTTETLLECFSASLPLAQNGSILKLATLITSSYRSSFASNSNKRKLFNLFLQCHLQRWLDCTTCIPKDEPHAQLLDLIYNTGVETFFNLDVLRLSLDSKSENAILSSLRGAASTSRIAIFSVLPRLFSSLLHAIKKHRASLFGQGLAQLPVSATSEINGAGMQFFVACQSLLDDTELSKEAWRARNALLDTVRQNNLFIRPLLEAETALNQICGLAIESLSAESDNVAFALNCLSTLAQIDYDIILSAMPRLLPRLFSISHGPRSTPFPSVVKFLDLLLDYHTKMRTIPNYVCGLLDIALSPRQETPIGYCDPREIYQSRCASVLLHPTHLDRIAKKVQIFVTATQTLHLAKEIVERLENAWADMEKSARRIRKDQKPDETSNYLGVSPEILAIRFSLSATFGCVVLSSLPVRPLPRDERESLSVILDTLRRAFVAKVVSKLNKKLRDRSCREVWEWQICAAAALRIGYVLDVSRNLSLPRVECNPKLMRRMTELARNGDVLPELSLESFRYLLSKAAFRDQTETQALIDHALTYIEERLAPTESRWSGYAYQLTSDGKGKANSALALLHMLVERWLPVIDAHASAEQLRRLMNSLMSLGRDTTALRNGEELWPRDVLEIVLRSAQFWELFNIRPVFLSFLTDSTSVLDNPSDAAIPLQAISRYEVMLYTPMEYFTKNNRVELVKRALSADLLLSAKAHIPVRTDTAHLVTVLRIFLKRVFTHTSSVDHSAAGLVGFLEHLTKSDMTERTSVRATLDLIELYFQELLRNAARGDTDIVRMFNSMEAWIASEKIIAAQAVVRMIELMTTKFLITSFSKDIKMSLTTAHTQLVAYALPWMSSFVNHPTIRTVSSQNNMISLWSSLLSFGHWLGQQNEIQMFGHRLASSIMMPKDEDQTSPMMHEARVMTISLMFRELQCLSEGKQVDQLEQIIAVYASFAPVLDDNSRERVDSYMSRAFKSISVSNYAHTLNLVSETLANARPDVMVQIVHLATRLLKDYPQNTLKHTQAFTTQCIRAFASRVDVFIKGSVDLRIKVLDYVVQLCSERPAALRSNDLSGIWHLISKFLASSHLHDDETSTTIYHRAVSAIGALVRLRRDLVMWTLPHLAMMLRQLIQCLRACRPMLGARQTAMVMDTQPQWVSAKQPLGAEEAKVLSRLMETLNMKTVARTHAQTETHKAESLAKPFSKHAVYVVKAYVESMNDPLCVMGVEVRRELEPGLFALCGMVSEYARDAVMVSALDAGGKAVMKALWKEYEKQKYVGQG